MPNEEMENLFYPELSIRFKPNSIHRSLAFLKDKWISFFPGEQFDYYFIDEKLNTMYRAEQRMGEIFKYFSFLAILLACLGLYGLTALVIEQKNKDIGIHKVLGATISNIVALVSKNYLLCILFANIIAWPTTWFVMNMWLQNFAFRISMEWWMFILPGLTVLIVALLTVSWQSIRAATANPVEVLKYE